MANVLPSKDINLLGLKFNLNPGPFNVKEHTIITMMAAAGSAYSYAIEILLAQEVFYKQRFGWGFQTLLIISTQAMGFGIAGIARRFLVWPASMVWPANLVTCAVMHALHKHEGTEPASTNGWAISRYRFFLLVSVATFFYQWVPEVMAPFLQYFTFACWIAPDNVLVNQLFGHVSGLGILPITFDWLGVSSWLGSPLQTPLFAILNISLGLVICLVGTLGLAYGGPVEYKYLPLSANKNWDRFARPYNTSRILSPDLTVNETAYKAYSPILLGATFSLGYGMSFATLVSTLSHVGLFYGPDIWRRAFEARSDEPDVHMRLMQKYREAPEFWFTIVFVISFAFGMTASQVWDTHLPWWAYIVCILIAAVFFIPIGMIQAITNQQPGLNIITEMIFGYM
ncbi:hypothetical protein E4U43_006699 [Claviceps pusilla]|uniref:Uncharacterized protein n=1 Tax=Claviceps pusilla TaxID=123648 RepID=A0A9P7N3J5_9HYPO|nr:hypothetical protein E4U43_006699 [Claviceps pusilla]